VADGDDDIYIPQVKPKSHTKHNFLKVTFGTLKRVYPKVPGLSLNEIDAYNNKHSLRNNTIGYGGKTHQTVSQNSDTTAPSGRELYHLQFKL